ncbi:DUF1998 domain-containing protein [Halobacillus litoralis]|uniref:DUF1998 domain-containing protein n=1 Tax=Halobacillus litoralis TaxID=45668 RepID=A0A845FD12_9BACI|nr:DUF1998 domain-containing protein [Halobacillus litoralis]MYL71731.1 DUF1998 domain-containing protein [Halobacillus litoralis]
MNSKSPGGMRPSQIVTTFGPGSLIDFKNDSVMVMGLQDWVEQEGYYKRLNEPRLSARLNISSFLEPKSSKGKGGIPVISFPKYRVCSKCGSLRKNFNRDRYRFFCDCSGKKITAYPARLIMACEDGHIDDFPWAEWAHKGKDNVCEHPDLYLKTRGSSSALDDINIECKSCKKGFNTLSGALKKDALESVLGKCDGSSPWKRQKSSRCDKVPRGLQRGASNVYFSSSISALSIPPWTDDLQELVSSKWKDIVDIIQEEGFSELKSGLKYIFRGVSQEELDNIYDIIKQQYKMGQEKEDIRYEEWKAFQEDKKITKHFHIEEEAVHQSIQQYISRIVLVHRLREVRALRGFTRIDYPDPNNETSVSYSYLSRNADIDWLPAVEISGEGLFIQLNEDELKSWEKMIKEKNRYNKLLKRYENWRTEKDWGSDSRFTERFILLHSLSHALIRELSLSCGYSSNSIREKVYCDTDMYGILLYTGSPDSDGSLGGIIQQGRKEQFHKLLKQSILRSKVCTSDPLCSEAENVVESRLNLSACHACSLVSETSCEWSNILLDRLSLFKSNNNDFGFFHSI